MAQDDLLPDAVPDAGIAEPQQSAVTAIRRAAQQGWLTAAHAGLLIDRVHAHAAAPPLPIEDSQSPPATGTPRVPSTDPDRTVP